MGKTVQSEAANVTEMVVRGILIQQCDWLGTFTATMQARKPLLVTLGLQRCIPPSMTRRFKERQVYFPEDAIGIALAATRPLPPRLSEPTQTRAKRSHRFDTHQTPHQRLLLTRPKTALQ